MIRFCLCAPSGTAAGPGSLAGAGDLIAPADASRILLVTDAGTAAAGRFWTRSSSRRPPAPATTGMDARAHALECYLSTKANALSDLLALEATRLIAANVCRAFDNPHDRTSCQAMLTAAYYAGLYITLSGTTAVHALSYPLGAVFFVPHGRANAMLLPPVMEITLPALPEKARKLAEAMGTVERSGEEDHARGLVSALEDLLEHLRIPGKMSRHDMQSIYERTR